MEKEEIILINIFEKIKNKFPLIKSIHIFLQKFYKKIIYGSEITLEEWEQMERKYSPHSSHHAQIYYRDKL